MEGVYLEIFVFILPLLLGFCVFLAFEAFWLLGFGGLLAFRLRWLVDFFGFSLSDFWLCLAFCFHWILGSSPFLLLSTLQFVLWLWLCGLLTLWLVFFPFRLLWFVGLAGFDCFCGFWLLCFFSMAYWCMAFVFCFGLRRPSPCSVFQLLLAALFFLF